MIDALIKRVSVTYKCYEMYAQIFVIVMNKTLYNLYIKTTKEDKANGYAINMSREMQPNKNQRCMQKLPIQTEY
jgi:hypothetical protein